MPANLLEHTLCGDFLQEEFSSKLGFIRIVEAIIDFLLIGNT